MKRLIFFKLLGQNEGKIYNKVGDNNKPMLQKIKEMTLQKIKSAFLENKNMILYSLLGASVLSSYLFYGRYELARQHGIQMKKKQNKLDTSFEQLLRDNQQPNIMKIVFTQAEKGSGNFRKIVIDKIKEQFPKKDLGVLINCAPKKLFETGCESFIQTFQHDDEQYADYIVNLLKQQLLIEDSFQKIEKVSQIQNPDRFVIMICDNNCLDILRITTPREVYLEEKIHKLALDKLNIKISDLYDMYSLVIHFEEDPETVSEQEMEENIFIEKIWGDKSFRGFYQKFIYDKKKSKQDNVNAVIKFLHEKIRQYKRQQEIEKTQKEEK